MRKLWTRKDKRRSFGYAHESDAESTHSDSRLEDDNATLANASIVGSTIASIPESGQNTVTTDRTTVAPEAAQSKSLSSLVQPDYDSRTTMHSWLNVLSNPSSANDISESAMRVVRVELKGSHLYLHKANVNARSFRATTERSYSASGSSEPQTPVSAPTETPQDAQSYPQPPPTPNPNDNSRSQTTLPPKSETAISDQPHLQFTSMDTRHPELAYNDETHAFPPHVVNDAEPVAHFMLFETSLQDLSSVNQLIAILPLFPNFADILCYIQLYLSLTIASHHETETRTSHITDRVLKLLANVEENFSGFLLKSDIAPHILKIIESLSEWEPTNNKVSEFKRDMLAKQKLLMDLVEAAPSQKVESSNPFADLNSITFMKDIDLIEFAAVVTSIDLKFFKAWNSNIDKSLLLFSSLNNSHSSDYFYKKNTLMFNNDTHIHYLSRLFINHLFIEGTSPGISTSALSFEKKARLIEKWIDLGCLLDKLGNMSSWLGISSIILSQPILRLTKIWSLVSPDYIKLLKNDWSPVLFELDRRHLANGLVKANTSGQTSNGKEESNPRESYHIMAPRGIGKIYPKERVIPYFGDLVIQNAVPNVTELESIWKRINYSFNRWNEYLTNLNNYNEIIRYNDDVIRRYDSMGFIFSNESLNQVLYLGVNNDERSTPSFDEVSHIPPTTKSYENPSLEKKLWRLIDINCESIGLDKLMKLSLVLEPDLPEAYLESETMASSPLNLKHQNNSSLTVQSTDSATTLHSFDLGNKIPQFNNEYFKLKLSRYDELVQEDDEGRLASEGRTSTDTSNIVVDDSLVFRADDMIPDFESSMVNSSTFNAFDDVVENVDDEDDDAGLGIDVDVILNSEKFRNFSIEDDSEGSKKNRYERRKTHQSGDTEGDSTNAIPVMNFIPKYATIDRLIDILLLDAKYFEESLVIDLTEYRFVFLLNYNSFITTKELLEKLAHRFINSGNAVISVMQRAHALKTGEVLGGEFPNWNLDPTDPSINLAALGEVDYELLLKIQINILKVSIVLINNFYSNFATDLTNKAILIKLLKLFSNEILQWYNSNKIDSKLERSFESLVNYYKKLKKLFVKKTYRPIEISKFDEYLINEFKFGNSLHEVPMNRNLPGHKNVNKIEKFLHKFNKLLTVFYKGIRAEDWVRVFKAIEIEFENNNLMEYNLQRPTTHDDSLQISNIFSYFESLTDPVDKQLVLKKLPLVFRKLFKLYYKFRSYLAIQLTDLNITVEERLDRMKTLLIMVKLTKLKMENNQFVFEGNEGSIPSCIESAITNVIYSPESRLFTNLWIKASMALNGDGYTSNFGDLDSLLPRQLTSSDLIIAHEPLLPCFGWIIENLMAINKCPTYYKNCININKRYLIYKLIKELSVEDFESGDGYTVSYHDTREFEFLLKLDESLVNIQSLKEFTFLEKDRIKIFRTVLESQRSILVSDNKKKHMLEPKKESNPMHNVSGLTKKTSNTSLRRQSLAYKSNSASRFKISGLFSKSRPFSMSASSSSDKVVDYYELPDPKSTVDGKQKPIAVIALKNKKIFPVYLLPLCFKIDSDSSSDEYLFQAPNEVELNKWLIKLNYSNRHWFLSRALNLKGSPSIVFGVPINIVCNREGTYVPNFLTKIFAEVEQEGSKDVGIYRISSSVSELNALRSMIDKTGTVDFSERAYDVHALTSCVKLYFRELPDALISDEVISAVFELKQNGSEPDRDLGQFREVIRLLPPINYNTLKALLRHLNVVCSFSDTNKMTASNLATVIGPALTEASSMDSLINNFGYINLVVEKLITNYEQVFGDD
ncbi:hypothetical protein PGUG_00158 [Meyerozyma guilliermondii ATCC 6260]|uniref:Rho-GAP domain-containing protein n=1 Tax=Meyerozyma guilliermondii (strain ATCC 6260 / CBS 566 / DSM 6381 / JCM 1539 / NBRC 10279 / NRRL Y-324) TaxID=294746 RepID=A5DA53_PICGU|nr:uncharacterized protein PGUG_00158 [Meyerozyma guilliermondii ATCC 6260]EDK36060.2 hypothetical protein PGUG_00158 [Meyerozyma guilliermondii ATCC 6260]